MSLEGNTPYRAPKCCYARLVVCGDGVEDGLDGCHPTGVIWLGEPLAPGLVPLVVAPVSHEHEIEVIRIIDDGQLDVLIPVNGKRCVGLL